MDKKRKAGTKASVVSDEETIRNIETAGWLDDYKEKGITSEKFFQNINLSKERSTQFIQWVIKGLDHQISEDEFKLLSPSQKMGIALNIDGVNHSLKEKTLNLQDIKSISKNSENIIALCVSGTKIGDINNLSEDEYKRIVVDFFPFTNALLIEKVPFEKIKKLSADRFEELGYALSEFKSYNINDSGIIKLLRAEVAFDEIEKLSTNQFNLIKSNIGFVVRQVDFGAKFNDLVKLGDFLPDARELVESGLYLKDIIAMPISTRNEIASNKKGYYNLKEAGFPLKKITSISNKLSLKTILEKSKEISSILNASIIKVKTIQGE